MYITCIFLLLGCSPASPESEPDVSGEVLEIDVEESKFLVEGHGPLVGQGEETFQVWFSVGNYSEQNPKYNLMYDEDGNEINIEKLREGYNVNVWAQNGITLDSAPPQSIVEHLRVLNKN